MTTPMTPTATINAPFTDSREAFAEARRLISDRDFSGAIALLTPFAESGDRNVLFSLNYALERRRLPGDRDQSLVYLKKAAELGHPKATQLLARRKVTRLVGGKGYMTDLRPLLVETAKAFFPSGILADGDLHQTSDADLVSALHTVLCSKEHAADLLAQTVRGVLLLQDASATEESKAIALRLLQASADDGRTEAIRFLGRAYLEGILIPADAKKAFETFRYGNEMGCTESRHRLAECYLRGTGVDADIHEAVRLLKESTRSGHPYSPCVLGSLYLEGTKVPQDIVLGRDLLKLSVSRRCGFAAAQLADFYLWNPAFATFGYERQAYAMIALQFGDKSKVDQLKGLQPAEYVELMKSVNLIKSITPNPVF